MKIAVITIAITCKNMILEKMDLNGITRVFLPLRYNPHRERCGFEPSRLALKVVFEGGGYRLRLHSRRRRRTIQRCDPRPVSSRPRGPCAASAARAPPPRVRTGSVACRRWMAGD